MAIRFKRKTENTWKVIEPNTKYIKKSYRKRNGRVMFPTSHDITIESFSGFFIPNTINSIVIYATDTMR